MRTNSARLDRRRLFRPLLIGAALAACAASAFLLANPFGAALASAFAILGVAVAACRPKPVVPSRPSHVGLLEEAARVLMVDADPSSALAKILRLAVRRLDAHAGAILLRSEDSDGTFLAEAQFSRQEGFEFPYRLPKESELCRRILVDGKPHIFTASGEGSMIGLPISIFVRRGTQISESSGVGIVLLQFPDGAAIDKDLEESLTELAGLIGMAIAPGWHRRNIQQTLSRTLEMLVNLFEGRCEFTEGHSARVSVIAVELGRKLGLGYESLEDIRLGALLHDIGKIGIPESILNKPDRLTAEDFEIIRQHPVIGYEMCKPVHLPDCVLKIVRNHHENLDGTGYPDRLSGSDLTLYMRIVAVADSFDAMCSRRAYRDPMEMEKVIGEVTRNAGTQFDPVVVEKLKDMIGEEWLQVLYQTMTGSPEGRAA